ncbi:PAS domain S-box-containing protein [Ectothiorhodospira magna]|uniref:histidine kinase n=1 Tax=Ectothiorhodospira magna TaxID=867345 RepID=A0A1H9GWG8_9GAMM|nr:PAS domain S-box-containing protein [Ectothiorhodospira magna]
MMPQKPENTVAEVKDRDRNSGNNVPGSGSMASPPLSFEAELLEAQRIAQVGSWVADFQKNVIRWSPEVYRIFGLCPNAWNATHEAFMSLVHPEDRVRVQAAVDAALAGETYDIEHRVLRPDGTIRIVRECGSVEFDDAGRPWSIPRFSQANFLLKQRDNGRWGGHAPARS